MRLSVNIDHVATLRQARGEKEPDPVWAASLCELAGADGITFHLREDRRHMQDRDARLLAQTVRSSMNMEMAATPEMFSVAMELMPDQVTLVPEKRQELTTEGGLDVVTYAETLASFVQGLHEKGILVSLFVDPEPDQIKQSAVIGADVVELHTGPYSRVKNAREQATELARLARMAEMARKMKLEVHVGHGLNYRNVLPLRDIPELEEASIGHAIIAQAVFTGLDRAVREMKELLAG